MTSYTRTLWNAAGSPLSKKPWLKKKSLYGIPSFFASEEEDLPPEPETVLSIEKEKWLVKRKFKSRAKEKGISLRAQIRNYEISRRPDKRPYLHQFKQTYKQHRFLVLELPEPSTEVTLDDVLNLCSDPQKRKRQGIMDIWPQRNELMENRNRIYVQFETESQREEYLPNCSPLGLLRGMPVSFKRMGPTWKYPFYSCIHFKKCGRYQAVLCSGDLYSVTEEQILQLFKAADIPLFQIEPVVRFQDEEKKRATFLVRCASKEMASRAVETLDRQSKLEGIPPMKVQVTF